ncbi:MAG: hypothetical protein Kow00127_04970 [Bacteroidales bacterium]
MSVKNILHRIGVLFTAIAISWLFAGRLIEFHQRYVFHSDKGLWQVVAVKAGKDEKKSGKFLQKDQPVKSLSGTFTAVMTDQISSGSDFPGSFVNFANNPSFYFFLPVEERYLRGPPQA